MVALNQGQQEAADSIELWYNLGLEDKQIYTLAGYAGTGKTFLINYIINERLKLKQDAKILGYEELVNYYKRFKLYGSIFVGWLKRKGREKAWKKIISNSNRKVHELRKYIEQQGNQVLLVNTDAVKFINKVDYNETTDLGGFKYEWKDTTMYIKGIKSYGFVNEDGKWEFRQAGKTKLDRIKPDRNTWTFDEYVNGVDGKYSVIKIDRETKHLVEVFE